MLVINGSKGIVIYSKFIVNISILTNISMNFVLSILLRVIYKI